jgi:hypothetical protein
MAICPSWTLLLFYSEIKKFSSRGHSGLLGFFLFRALKHHIKDSSIYFTATFFCLLIGTFDEILQWITPRRFWDFQDVGLNTLSGGLFLLTIWKVLKPKVITEKINPKSIRILTSISIVCILVLGLCASNTPRRVAHYTNLMPTLSFLQEEEPMSEFGDIYKDSEIGAFFSRLTLNNLIEIDKKNSQSYAQLLNRSENMEYEQFLRRYNPIVNPFLYELRVHTYRRDKYYRQARAFSDLKKKKESYFIAYKENLILDKYFSNTIRESIYAWDEDEIKEAEALIDKSKPYKSPVSANLFTPFSEKTMWIIIFVLIILLIFVNLTLSLKKKRHRILKQ